MNLFEYCTLGGKNLIEKHFKSLEIHIYTRYLDVKNLICDGDIHVFELLDTKHITWKIYEIRDIDLAISRAKKYSLL